MRTLFRIPILLVCLVFSGMNISYPENGAAVSLNFVEYFPVNATKVGVPFEVVFKLKNTGSAPINPYAEVTLYGKVYDMKGNMVLTMVDKKYRVYNFWPGDESGRQRFYIGALQKGTYKMVINVDSFDRGKNVNISSTVFERTLNVE